MGLSEEDNRLLNLEVNRLVNLAYKKSAVSILPINLSNTESNNDDSDSDSDWEDGGKREKFKLIPIKDWPAKYVEVWANERMEKFDAAKKRHSDDSNNNEKEEISEDDLVTAIAVAERAYYLTRGWFLVYC